MYCGINGMAYQGVNAHHGAYGLLNKSHKRIKRTYFQPIKLHSFVTKVSVVPLACGIPDISKLNLPAPCSTEETYVRYC